MPIYEYACRNCGGFTALRRLADYESPCVCPRCGTLSSRALFTAPAFTAMPSARRLAHAANEKARHEPMLASQAERKHGAGCSCCGAKKSSAASTGRGGKHFPGKRPWMISH